MNYFLIILVTFSCTTCLGENQPANNEVKNKGEKHLIKKGMELTEALKIVSENGLTSRDLEGPAVEFTDHLPRKWFMISPLEWTDSLTIRAVFSKKREALVVESIYWVKNWREEYFKAKIDKQNDRTYVNEINLKPVIKKLGLGNGLSSFPKRPNTEKNRIGILDAIAEELNKKPGEIVPEDYLAVTKLMVSDYALMNIEQISILQNLTALELSCCEQLTNIKPLAKLHKLNKLTLGDCESVVDLLPLIGLHNLTILELYGCNSLTNISPLGKLDKLEVLDLSDCHSLTHLGSISKIKNLTEFYLTHHPTLTDLQFLAKNTNLKVLDLSDCVSLNDITALSSSTNLEEIYLNGCKSVSDLKPLFSLPNLILVEAESTSISKAEKIRMERHLLENRERLER